MPLGKFYSITKFNMLNTFKILGYPFSYVTIGNAKDFVISCYLYSKDVSCMENSIWISPMVV